MKNIINALKGGTFCPKRFNIFRTDSGGRVYIRDEYKTDSSEAIRAPSRDYPWSEFKHAFTKKYQVQLLAKLEQQATQKEQGLIFNVGIQNEL